MGERVREEMEREENEERGKKSRCLRVEVTLTILNPKFG